MRHRGAEGQKNKGAEEVEGRHEERVQDIVDHAEGGDAPLQKQANEERDGQHAQGESQTEPVSRLPLSRPADAKHQDN